MTCCCEDGSKPRLRSANVEVFAKVWRISNLIALKTVLLSLVSTVSSAEYCYRDGIILAQMTSLLKMIISSNDAFTNEWK